MGSFGCDDEHIAKELPANWHTNNHHTVRVGAHLSQNECITIFNDIALELFTNEQRTELVLVCGDD